jgi:beta-glucanase (GH16 family)
MDTTNGRTRNRCLAHAAGILFLALVTATITITAQAAAPVGQTIWIHGSGTGLFVSADQNLGSTAPLVSDRSAVSTWEEFQVVDEGGGFVAFKSVGTGLFVSADLNLGSDAPLVADRPTASTWEEFTWTDLSTGEFTLEGRATSLFVSADLSISSTAPLVCNRPTASTWEHFTWSTVGGNGAPNPSAPSGFTKLLWSDEFNGPSITSNWVFDLGAGGWGNNELEDYTNSSQNARIVNGNLVIEALQQNLNGSQYTSARMNTSGQQAFGTGTWMEARIQAPQGQGIWPAFWSLGTDINTVNWPECGEIDIMEMQGQNPFTNFGTMHWANTSGQAVSYGGTVSSSTSYASGYHTYALERTSTAITWFVDGVQYVQGNIASGINNTQSFQNQFFILLNVAVGGNFVGSPNSSTVFPQQMLVDYVRVWGN